MSKSSIIVNKYFKRLKTGEDCFDELFKYASGYAEQVAFLFLKDKSKTDDVIVRTFVKVNDHIAKFDESKSGLAWICKIAEHEALKINRDSIKKEVPINEDEIAATCDETVTLESIDLKIAMSRLDEEERKLLDYRLFQDMTLHDIAKLYNVDQSSIYRRLKNIYKKLKKFLD